MMMMMVMMVMMMMMMMMQYYQCKVKNMRRYTSTPTCLHGLVLS